MEYIGHLFKHFNAARVAAITLPSDDRSFVDVGMDNSVEVEFKCSDPYQEVLAIMSEVQNE